jgi:dTDP-4-amino-4,6-dideoxy-D-galactose acyltransferase
LESPSANGSELAEVLPWDSEFWGFRIARATFHTLTRKRAQDVDGWCLDHAVRCLYFLARADDASTPRAAEAWGSRFVDIRMTFGQRRPLALSESRSAAEITPTIRPNRPEDLPLLARISRQSYQDSRFYYDGGFPRDRCDLLYETWIANSCRGYADLVLVAELADEPAGFITCHLDREHQGGRIGLVGVSRHAQGQGLGHSLVGEALRWLWLQGARQATVVTQGRNTSAQRLYERCGFVTDAVELWYHQWYDTAEAGR